MQNEIPDEVSLDVRNGESQADFARRLFIEAARTAGLPLLDQASFADDMIKSGAHLVAGKDEKPRLKWANDPSPKDNDPLVSDAEWRAKYGKRHTHTLTDFNHEDLRLRQIYYTMNGGVLGSQIDLRDVEEITVDLNVIYDTSLITDNVAPQTKLEYIQQNFQPKLQYWTETFYHIGLLYTVRYTVGGSSFDRKKITAGKIPGMVNIFYLNDRNKTESYGKAKNGTDEIFMSEKKNNLLRKEILCHEIGHTFGITALTGVSALDWFLDTFWIANTISDAQINSALSSLESNSVKYGVDWIDDYRKAPKHIYYTPQIAKLGPDAARRIIQRKPTIYDLFRYGARIIKEQKK